MKRFPWRAKERVGPRWTRMRVRCTNFIGVTRERECWGWRGYRLVRWQTKAFQKPVYVVLGDDGLPRSDREFDLVRDAKLFVATELAREAKS